MDISSASFVISNSDFTNCPKTTLPEYAFIGRSNVGKSSLINMLTGQRKLAKISGTPGKTQLINHFLINNDWHLVDLPGYGYAKSSKKDRKDWKKMIDGYLLSRENLLCTFVLLDVRHDLQKIDLEFMTWMAEHQLPFAIVFTKADKLGQQTLPKNVKKLKAQILQYWEELPPNFLTSSEKNMGGDLILQLIDETNQSYKVE
jgi:GTP-binding protein